MVVLDKRLTWKDVEADPMKLRAWQEQDWSRCKADHCYTFQKERARECQKPLLNAACGPDPAGLGTLGATNMDVQSVDAVTGNRNDQLPNFTPGTVFDMPFSDEAFASVMLGEFLEHCTEEKAREALREIRRVLFQSGMLYITVPLDGRPVYEQNVMRVEMGEREYCPGVTNYHQTWWSNRMLQALAEDTGFEEVKRVTLVYQMTAPVMGWGLSWRKV